MTIGEKIKQMRTESHMTQDALAQRLHISSQAISKWEQNLSAPDISLLPELAEVFRVTTDELLGAGRYRTASGYRTYRGRLAAIYEEGGTETDFQKAEAAYADVLLHGTPTTEDYMMYGYLYDVRSRRDAEMALRYYEKALDAGDANRDGWWFKTHQQISLLLCSLGRGEEAIQQKLAWLEHEPDNVQAYLAVIWALYHAGRAKEALPWLEKVQLLAPEDPQVCAAAGDVLGGEKGLGRYEEAFVHWDKALALDGSFADCLYSKAHAYEQLGQYQNAIAEYRKICDWLRHWGADIGVESCFAEARIGALEALLSANRTG